VAFIESEEPSSAQLARHNHQAEVRQPHIKVVIASFQLGNYTVIVSLEAYDNKSCAREVIEKCQACSTAKPASQQIVDLSGDRCRDN
jgi:hypothetical protein